MTYPDLPTLEQLTTAQRRGDDLADAVADAVHDDPAVRGQFARALREGSSSAAHPAVRAFVAEQERVAAAGEADLLAAGARATFTAPLAVHVFDTGAGALISSYRPPGPAAVLTGTGRLVHGTQHRLTETARWLSAASLPGGLVRGAEGWVMTAWVRLGHAVARRDVQRASASPDGVVPISQMDSVRTWLDFTVVAPRSAHRLGFAVTDAEYAQFLTYWQFLGSLLGVEPQLIAGAVDRRSAGELLRRVDALTGPPSQDSRVLTEAGIEALAVGLRDLVRVPLGPGRIAARTVARHLQGPDLGRALGLGDPAPQDRIVPVAAAVNRAGQTLLRRSDRVWNAVVELNVWTNRRFLRESAELVA
ncbi:oxygenase MpaB family protein [Kineococcus sp. TBRC 1896]|uniref:Oxygenase MpaB family protein n=1 Tax=Kineococcus mangrovi TaxID=1660183 RepID=A0ABV4I7D1_9ACTN